MTRETLRSESEWTSIVRWQHTDEKIKRDDNLITLFDDNDALPKYCGFALKEAFIYIFSVTTIAV